ncbi:hypothetical protein AXX17_AT5G36880 [Arabidopsis thaliana]|uniref:Uncharacterized protein n=1 Tax=Arabidopsis thaliana TaxID=3702 RepID=A0A178U8R5_ARATH|nr:hypothetical protein AXX17_AT5G36880 [Arabidopsis thaliana]
MRATKITMTTNKATSVITARFINVHNVLSVYVSLVRENLSSLTKLRLMTMNSSK